MSRYPSEEASVYGERTRTSTYHSHTPYDAPEPYDEVTAAHDRVLGLDSEDGEYADAVHTEPEKREGSRIGRRRARVRKKRERRRSFVAFTLVALLLVGLTGGGWWGYGKVRDWITPPDYEGRGSGSVDVQIEAGDSATDVANTLAESDVVKSARAFIEVASSDQRATSLQPGTYRLRKQMKAQYALELLLDPASRVSRKVTIPEGKSVRQTLEILEEKTPLSAEEIQKAASDSDALGVPEWVPSEVSGVERLEGFLAPATYDVQPSMSARDVLKMMVDRANQMFTSLNFVAEAGKTGRSPYEILTVASLIEGEGIVSDFKKISRVVYNRLSLEDAPQRLDFDSTTQYWLEKTDRGRRKRLTDAEIKHPDNNYSTTLHEGLPPTAIASPGEKAIDAALHPATGNWLYFVLVSEDGSSAFAATHEEHLKNVQICRDKDLGC